MTSRPAGRRSGAAGLRRRILPALLAGLASLPACGRPDPGQLRVIVDWPHPPSTGTEAVASLRLVAASGQPIAGAHLEVQGFMSHPGMAPVEADVEERGDGVYRARFRFTMAGEWIVRVTGSTRDGRTFDQPHGATVLAAHGQ